MLKIIALLIFTYCQFRFIIWFGDYLLKKKMAAAAKKNNFIEKYNKIKNKIYKHLVQVCYQNELPIVICEAKDMISDGKSCAGQFVYMTDIKTNKMIRASHINILAQYKGEPFLLGHELGHYYSVKDHNDKTEDAADKKGAELCLGVLSEEEKKIAGSFIENYYKAR